MKRKYSLFSLMAVTALSLSLAACDDNSADTAATTETAVTTEVDAAPDFAAPAAVVRAEGATSYATAEGVTTGAVFLTLHNPQAEADRLVGASTPVATTVELHESAVDENGIMQMNRVDAIEIQAGQQVNLEPGGYHIMLMGLTSSLAEGAPFDITLDFENAEDVTLSVTVVAAATGEDHSHNEHDDHSGHDHGPEGEELDATATDATAEAVIDESPAEIMVEETVIEEGHAHDDHGHDHAH